MCVCLHTDAQGQPWAGAAPTSASRPLWGPGPRHLPALLLLPHEPHRPAKGRGASPPMVGAHEGDSHLLPDKASVAGALEAKSESLSVWSFPRPDRSLAGHTVGLERGLPSPSTVPVHEGCNGPDVSQACVPHAASPTSHNPALWACRDFHLEEEEETTSEVWGLAWGSPSAGQSWESPQSRTPKPFQGLALPLPSGHLPAARARPCRLWRQE